VRVNLGPVADRFGADTYSLGSSHDRTSPCAIGNTGPGARPDGGVNAGAAG
jgi:hypothetical protein